MITPSAIDVIRERRRATFSRLEANGSSSGVADALERFLQTPGTLRRPSLIVRCRRVYDEFSCWTVTDKPISRMRLEDSFLPFLRRLQHRSSGPCDFFVLVSDNIYVSPSCTAELLRFLDRVAFLRCDRCDEDEISTRAILIPDFSLQHYSYAEELDAISEAAEAIDFDSRIDVIQWRGRLSGPDYPTVENCSEFARFRLLMLSQQHPDIIDARLIVDESLSRSESALALKQRLKVLFGDPVDPLPAVGFVPYKYRVSVDGAVSAWRRVPTILASGSVLLLQHRWSQFFYPGLIPWEHYVPLAPDLSDLLDRYACLKADPARARAIAENGRRFAREVLHPQTLDDYFVEVLDACASLHCARSVRAQSG